MQGEIDEIIKWTTKNKTKNKLNSKIPAQTRFLQKKLHKNLILLLLLRLLVLMLIHMYTQTRRKILWFTPHLTNIVCLSYNMIRMATLLFPKLCLAAHNCIPNTHGVLHEDSKSGKPTYTMELIASLPIPEGAQIHTTYANVCEGTVERREVLQDHYFFSCSCKRCASPTVRHGNVYNK